MRVKGVVDALTLVHLKMESECRAARQQRLATVRSLLARRVVLLLEMLSNVLAACADARVELKRLAMQVLRNLVTDAHQGLLERPQAYNAPGTRDIRYE